MRLRSTRRLCVGIGIGALLSCDATAPAIERSLLIEGAIVEGGEAPLVPLPVAVQVWVPGSNAVSLALETDPQGRYAVTIGPTLTTLVDSVRVQVTQLTCQGTPMTAFIQRHLDASGGDTLTLPSVSLSPPGVPAQASQGGSSCAAITASPEDGLGDFLELALWHDELEPLPHGRWQLNHQASSADDYGYFDGRRTAGGLELVLHSSTACGTFALTIPVGGANGVTFGPADLTYTGPCPVPPRLRVRFFDGAVLTSTLPGALAADARALGVARAPCRSHLATRPSET